tara:strand:+ start:839 stop:1081 length:243 start_codon:yes stop_codon:yes gene_type:complete
MRVDVSHVYEEPLPGMPSLHIGTVCQQCGLDWADTFRGKAIITYEITEDILECEECEGESLVIDQETWLERGAMLFDEGI